MFFVSQWHKIKYYSLSISSLEWIPSLTGDVAALAHDAVLFGEALDAPHEVLRLPVHGALFQGLSQELPPL